MKESKTKIIRKIKQKMKTFKNKKTKIDSK